MSQRPSCMSSGTHLASATGVPIGTTPTASRTTSSVMNYAFQSTDYYPNRPLDYSRQQLPTLDESALVEATGSVALPATRPCSAWNRVRRLVSANAPIDWNGDGDTNDTVAADPNRLEYSCGRTPGELLKGGDDWRNLLWSFAASPDRVGTHFTSDTLATSELTDDIATSVAATSDVDADGVSNLADLCPSVPDPAQSDIDGDGVGDLCDTLNGVTIDVRPTSGQKNKVKGDVKVTILATPHFASDRQVDRTSLTFGKLGTKNSRLRCLTPADVNGDTRKDLTCVFRLSRTDLAVGTPSAC